MLQLHLASTCPEGEVIASVSQLPGHAHLVPLLYDWHTPWLGLVSRSGVLQKLDRGGTLVPQFGEQLVDDRRCSGNGLHELSPSAVSGTPSVHQPYELSGSHTCDIPCHPVLYLQHVTLQTLQLAGGCHWG